MSQDSVVWRSGGSPLWLVAWLILPRSLMSRWDLERSQGTGAHAIWCLSQFHPRCLSLPIRFPSSRVLSLSNLHPCPRSYPSIRRSACNTSLTKVLLDPSDGHGLWPVCFTRPHSITPLSLP